MNRLSHRIVLLFLVCVSSLGAGSAREQGVAQASLLPNGIHRGMVLSCKKDLSECITQVDALISAYKGRYSVDTKQRSIAVEKPLTSQERSEIGSASKRLDGLVRKLSRCSPGDYDYLDVKNVYLPLLKEMQHQLHTFVMQPLGVTVLDLYDHARNILVPITAVAIAVGVILVLSKNNVLPQSWCRNKGTLFTIALVVVVAGIIYNYRHILMPSKKLPLNTHAVDFDTLAWVKRTHEALKAAPEGIQQELARDIIKAVGSSDIVVTF